MPTFAVFSSADVTPQAPSTPAPPSTQPAALLTRLLFWAEVGSLLAEGEGLLQCMLFFCMGGSGDEEGGAEQSRDNFLFSTLSHTDRTKAELDESMWTTEKKAEFVWMLMESNLAEQT